MSPLFQERMREAPVIMKVFYINLVVSILLIVGGFLCPPIGSIDGSVLTAVGLLLLFSIVEKVPEAIAAGRSVKIQKGDTSVEVTTKDPE